jgi:hypothetical protein
MRANSHVIYVDLPNTTDGMLPVHGYNGAYERFALKFTNCQTETV